jgi:hypothetical protein
MDLFLSHKLAFEKTAAEVKLPEDPSTWEVEILQELHKKIPYVADFSPRVVLDRTDAERGMAFGHIEVTNRTEIQAANPATLEAAGINEVRIPIVIRNGRLSPFDVLVTPAAKMMPLTESRLRQTLFRPQMFDTTSQTPGDTPMVGQLYPPMRQQSGGMFGGGGSIVMAKEGSISLLEAILPTAHESDFLSLATRISTSPALKLAFATNASAQKAMQQLSTYEPTSSAKTAAALASTVQPTTAQLRKCESGGYAVKMASHFYWSPVEQVADRGQAVRAFGEKIVLAADLTGSVTMAQGDVVSSESTEGDRPSLVKDYGIYRVKGPGDGDVIGFVFPNLLDTDGTPLPISLFTNGSQVAVQAEISGVRVSDGATLFEGGKPKGAGCFYRVLPNGKAEATIPFTVRGAISEQGEVGFVCETHDGRPVKLLVQPGITKVVEAEDGITLIPEAFRWMPLDRAEHIVVSATPEEFSKEARADAYTSSVVIRSGGESFTLSGPPVEKIASDARSFLSLDDALFVLAGCGVAPAFALHKLGQAVALHAPVACPVARHIQTAKHAYAEAIEKAASYIPQVSTLRKDLLKEAASVPDPMAVDTILSLGFLNPENIATFVAYLPQIDETQAKLCELLVASRLGLKEIPVSALERAIKSVEDVAEGLKVLAFQN